MQKSIIKKLYEEFIATKKCAIPDHLLPCEKGYNLTAWIKELLLYYGEEGVVVRPFDELPPLKISTQEGLFITMQDVHKFVISDLSFIPIETRRAILDHAVSHEGTRDAWAHILPLLLEQLGHMDGEAVMEDLSWRFSPVAELLWVVSWFFLEREAVAPPDGVRMFSDRFPYYLWLTEDKKLSLWEPEIPVCRWEWLALDLFSRWKQQNPDK